VIAAGLAFVTAPAIATADLFKILRNTILLAKRGKKHARYRRGAHEFMGKVPIQWGARARLVPVRKKIAPAPKVYLRCRDWVLRIE